MHCHLQPVSHLPTYLAPRYAPPAGIWKPLGLLLLLSGLAGGRASAQISPPGLGRGHTADWLALGISKDLDSLKRWNSVSYVGMGRKSNPDNYNPLYKSAIFVLNQEFYYRFHKHWQSSLALSYRHQNAYLDTAPFTSEDPGFEQEFRLYGRFSYVYETPRFKIVPTFRQEFRKFYNPAFIAEDERFQLRTRLRLQVAFNLDNRKIHRLIVSSEELFSSSRFVNAPGWTSWADRESRFVAYYSMSPKSLPITFDFGYMANRLRNISPTYVHYLALDAIWKLPYRHRGTSGRPAATKLE
jgi:hypothetical protein